MPNNNKTDIVKKLVVLTLGTLFLIGSFIGKKLESGISNCSIFHI